MELSGYLPALRRWWWLLVLAAAVAGGMGGAVADRMTPTYEAGARLLVGPIETDRDTLLAAGQLAQTYAELATSGPLLEATIATLSLDVPARQLRERVAASANDVTRLVSVQVRDSDPTRAAAIANTVADLLANEPTGAPLDAQGLVSVIDPAEAPRSPVAPNVPLIILLGALAGTMTALAVVLTTERLRDRIAGPEELAELARTDVMGVIPRPGSPAASSATVVVDSGAHSQLATAYRLLAAKVQFGRGGDPVTSIVVLGARPGLAGTDVAVNLAAALASAGRDVLLAGFENAGRSCELVGVPPRPGTLQRLASGNPVGLVDVPVGHRRHLFVLPYDPLAPETLTATLAADILESQRQAQGITVVAVDPIAQSSDAVIWARAADAVVLVADPARARRRDIVRALDGIRPVTVGLIWPVLYDGRSRHPEPITWEAPEGRQQQALSIIEGEGAPQGATVDPVPLRQDEPWASDVPYRRAMNEGGPRE